MSTENESTPTAPAEAGDCGRSSLATGSETLYYMLQESQMQRIAAALNAGLESSRTELADHDARLGRSIARNKTWAETLERQISEIEDVIAGLPNAERSHDDRT